MPLSRGPLHGSYFTQFCPFRIVKARFFCYNGGITGRERSFYDISDLRKGTEAHRKDPAPELHPVGLHPVLCGPHHRDRHPHFLLEPASSAERPDGYRLGKPHQLSEICHQHHHRGGADPGALSPDPGYHRGDPADGGHQGADHRADVRTGDALRRGGRGSALCSPEIPLRFPSG